LLRNDFHSSEDRRGTYPRIKSSPEPDKVPICGCQLAIYLNDEVRHTSLIIRYKNSSEPPIAEFKARGQLVRVSTVCFSGHEDSIQLGVRG
jgi:hypothetical protein